MKSVVILFPGSNCCQDAFYALQKFNLNPTYVWHKETEIGKDIDLIVLPGGFSYGDYVRGGIIATYSPIIQAVYKCAEEGRYVIGICNGFQILTEIKILEGQLIKNNDNKFICKTIDLIVTNNDTVFTSKYQKKEKIKIPIAHKEGNFYCDDYALKQMQDQDLIAFRYENNPNGSVDNIAGILNKQKNVLGMMPHPERAIDQYIAKDISFGSNLFQSLLES